MDGVTSVTPFFIAATDETPSMTEEAGINIFSVQSAMID